MGVDVSIPLGTFPAPGEYVVRLAVTAPITGTGVMPPAPVTVSVVGYVTEEDCHEIEREWQEARLAKKAKKNDCEELAKRLAECEQALADREASLAAAQEALDGPGGLNDQLAQKQAEFEALFASVDQFLSGVGSLESYPPGGAPPGDPFVGARKGGASLGIGVRFTSPGALIDRMKLYQQVNGHPIGRDLNRLRDCAAQLDNLDAQKAAKEAEIADLESQIAELEAAIAAKQAALVVCMAECVALEQAIVDLVAANLEKLEQLEAQRKAEDALEESERKAEDLEAEADAADDKADEAEENIGGRAGSPEQVEMDEGHVGDARDCVAIAKQLIADAKALHEEARAEIEMGHPMTAEEMTAEANELEQMAEAKLTEARNSIRLGESNAWRRPPRECTDGATVTVEELRCFIPDGIVDLSLAPSGETPEEWAATLDAGQAVIDGLGDFFEMLGLLGDAADAVGVELPIGGTFGDPVVATQAIFDAFQGFLLMTGQYDVWVRFTGHIQRKRMDKICVHGRWTYAQVIIPEPGVVVMEKKIGKIFGSDRAERERQLAKALRESPRSFSVP